LCGENLHEQKQRKGSGTQIEMILETKKQERTDGPFAKNRSNTDTDAQHSPLPPNGLDRFVAFSGPLGLHKAGRSRRAGWSANNAAAKRSAGAQRTLCEDPSTGSRFTYFSDCIVMTANVTRHALLELFQTIHTLTGNLLQEDVFVRGAVTLGRAFHDDRYVYGTAVSRAVRLEQEVAVYPRTLLSPEVHEYAKAVAQDFLRWIEPDTDGHHFIHYLLGFAVYHREPKLAGTVVLDTDAERIRFNISRRLLNDSSSALEKARWFQAYWNRTVPASDGFPPIDADASISEPDGPKTYIVRRVVAS
jgi:hypothetical protein